MTPHSHNKPSDDPTFTARARSTWEIVRRVAVYLKPYKLKAFGTMACALLSLAFSLAYPHFIGSLIDDVIKGSHAEKLTFLVLALLGSFLLRDLFNSLRIIINNTLEQDVIFNMRRDVYARLQRMPVHYFDQRASGDLMTRVIED
ncbi:MAG TPA: ABC transporter transmembrane domain-containing protein, partial [Verrucomicrobiae bacterium]|nr:ABC transporter transmembrane domain-containing protein [Verrucomicrobiae bacterium]